MDSNKQPTEYLLDLWTTSDDEFSSPYTSSSSPATSSSPSSLPSPLSSTSLDHMWPDVFVDQDNAGMLPLSSDDTSLRQHQEPIPAGRYSAGPASFGGTIDPSLIQLPYTPSLMSSYYAAPSFGMGSMAAPNYTPVGSSIYAPSPYTAPFMAPTFTVAPSQVGSSTVTSNLAESSRRRSIRTETVATHDLPSSSGPIRRLSTRGRYRQKQPDEHGYGGDLLDIRAGALIQTVGKDPEASECRCFPDGKVPAKMSRHWKNSCPGNPHRVPQYSCPVCDQPFTTRSNMERHRNKKHS